jgi:hypothetical protein
MQRCYRSTASISLTMRGRGRFVALNDAALFAYAYTNNRPRTFGDDVDLIAAPATTSGASSPVVLALSGRGYAGSWI